MVAPERNGHNVIDDEDAFRRFKVQYLSEVEPRAIDWEWKPLFARGKLSIMEGDPGVGKSTLTMDFASTVSTGAKWPQTFVGADMLARSQSDPAGVVLVGVEDDAADTVVPRLIASGADRTRIARMVRTTDSNGDPKPFVIPDDVDELGWLIRDAGARLVIIDPITAFLSTKMAKAGDDPSTRQALMPLVELAEKHSVAIIMLRHWNKAVGMSAKHRGSGTIAYGGLARSVLAAAPLTETHENGATHALVVAKTNIAKEPQALGYTLVPSMYDPDIAIVKWCGPIDLSADQLVGADGAKIGDARKNAPMREAAADLLKELLADGPLPMSECVATVTSNINCGKKTVTQAAEQLNLKKQPVRIDGKIRRWDWMLPVKSVDMPDLSGNHTRDNAPG